MLVHPNLRWSFAEKRMVALSLIHNTSASTRIPTGVPQFCSLECVKLPWQKSDAPAADGSAATGGSTKLDLGDATTPSRATSAKAASTSKLAKTAKKNPGARNGNASADRPSRDEAQEKGKSLPKGYTPPKGRPTPKRHDQEVKRGVVRDPNAMTKPQQAQKRKELKASMSKEEWKDYKKRERVERREHNKEIQARMDAGDERYLMDRDKGEIRRYVRDWVDSRRFLSNYMLPAMVVLLAIMILGMFLPRVAEILSLVSMVFIIGIFVEAFLIGRRANRAVREKFPETHETGFGLGMYAYSRASQPRGWRTPKPKVEAGSKV